MLQENKSRKIFGMIVLILLLWLVIYFIVMWFLYSPLTHDTNTEDTTAASDSSYDYEAYSNPHEITTTPDYSVAEATDYLRQVIHDNYKVIGYSSDVSNSTITYTGRKSVVNNANCYIFTCSGKTYAVSIKLSACYVSNDGSFDDNPLTFNNTNYLW